MGEDYLIWSNEHEAWWRSNSNGYTTDAAQAGSYSKAEAFEICSRAGYRYNKHGREIFSELPIRRSDVLDLMINDMGRAVVR